jgi:hypothetical protein
MAVSRKPDDEQRRRERIPGWTHSMTRVVLGSTISKPIYRHGRPIDGSKPGPAPAAAPTSPCRMHQQEMQ